jgi:hypothetical protein
VVVRVIAAFSALVFFASADALARNTEHLFSVKTAVESATGREKLLDVPFYFAGQKHPGKHEVIGEWKANRSTRGIFRSDAQACQIAFLSALIALQERAEREGGDAIVGIKSMTRGVETSSASKYRCVAGATVVHVALSGTVVRTK